MSVEEVRLLANGLSFRALASGPRDGPAMLLLHGFPEGAESWLPQLEALAEAGRRVVAPDLRGYGGSDCPEGVELYRMPELVADVLAIAGTLGGGPFDLAGHDWGALVGWSLIVQHPSSVRTWSALSVGHPAALAELRDDPDQQARSSYIRLFRTEGKAEEVLSADGFQRLRTMYRFGPHPDAVPEAVVDAYVKGFERPYRLTAGLNYYRANLSDDTLAGRPIASEPVTTPTLMIWGDQDPALGRAGATGTERYMGGPYRLEVLEGAGHWLQFERPEEVSRLLVEHVTGSLQAD